MKPLLILAMAGAMALPAGAQTPKPKTPQYTQPLGIALEDWKYPHPFRFLELTNNGQRVRMAYMVYRSDTRVAGQRKTVLLLHGKNFSGFYWDGPARALNRAGYDVVIPDQIGFGKSSKPDMPYSFGLLANNTRILLNTFKIKKVIVVGNSMGGMLAVKFARKYPEMVEKLVLEDPIGLEDYRAKIGPVPFEKLFKTELDDTCPDKIRTFYKRYFVKWQPQFEQFVAIKSRLTLSGEFPRWATASARTYAPIFDEPIVPDFPLLKVPTLLIIGQQDRTVVGKPYAPPAVAKTMGNYPALGKAAQRAIPGARLVEFQDAAHIPHLEAPRKFNDTLLQFLKR